MLMDMAANEDRAANGEHEHVKERKQAGGWGKMLKHDFGPRSAVDEDDCVFGRRTSGACELVRWRV
jgi:hypothetical protein